VCLNDLLMTRFFDTILTGISHHCSALRHEPRLYVRMQGFAQARSPYRIPFCCKPYAEDTLMTYCLALNVDRGLIFCSDSRTNAGMDNIGSYSKMHAFTWPGERLFVLLSAGNLATTQAVVKKLHLDIEQGLVPNLLTVSSMMEAADYVGMASTQVQRNQASRDTANTSFEATFIFGGQLRNHTPEIFMIYPQGNYIHESSEHPFLQIGETKYGKPILDRVIKRHVDLERAARCALVSMNSTIRSNVTVGPPVELLIYERDSLTAGRRLYLTDDDPFARELSENWNEGLLLALENLPHFAWEKPTSLDTEVKLAQLKQQIRQSPQVES